MTTYMMVQGDPNADLGITTADDGYDAEFGGYPGLAMELQTDPWETVGLWAEANITDNQGRNVDYSFAGASGHVNSNPYTEGVVRTEAVENHALTGKVQRLVRPNEAQLVSGGPVSGMNDYRSALAMQLTQQMLDTAYDEASQVAVISGLGY